MDTPSVNVIRLYPEKRTPPPAPTPKPNRIYECTLMERPEYGDRRPVVIDGNEFTREIVAPTAGKARFEYWSSLREVWNEKVKFGDIRVRSLSKRKAPAMLHGLESRMETANSIIRAMAEFGRYFFSQNSDNPTPVEDPFIAHFKVDKAGELWFVDRYTRKSILVRHEGRWEGFSDGGTLHQIVKHLAFHIEADNPVNIQYFSPSPKWVCDGDLWGYGDDMPKVKAAVEAILQAVKS